MKTQAAIATAERKSLEIMPVALGGPKAAIRATQGKGLMPDGTSRFSIGQDLIHHYMGCSGFSNFTVLPEIALAKIREDAPFDKVCYIGCGVTTDRKALAEKFGLTHFVNPREVGGDLVAHLAALTDGGADYSSECVGNVDLMHSGQSIRSGVVYS